MLRKLTSDQSLVGQKAAIAAYSRFLESINTPVSLGVFLRIKYGCFDDLVSMKIDPKAYDRADLFKKDYQSVSGLAKAAFLPTTLNRRKAAVRSFKEAEEKCRLTNLKFDEIMYGRGLERLAHDDPEMFSLLSRARNLISRILGSLPETIKPKFGPGVTSLIKRNVVLPAKYSRELHVTPELYCYWRDIVGPLWAREVTDITIQPSNRVAFVPKNAKTDRAIAVEPHLNVYAQLGLGQAIRGKLRKWVDLDKGQEINRFLASKALDWDLATIDLSSASDTISRSLVWFLLPEEWVMLLDRCRSHRYLLDNEEHEAEKFSSMGNGFTFELETVIFYALARASGSNPVYTTAYGDDIIAEKSVYSLLVRALEFCGFSVNLSKSFSEGLFYESCGRDYFNGVDVRPFFWKELRPTSIYKMINDISRFSLRPDGTRDRTYLSAYSFLHSLIKGSVWDNPIPYGIGDVGIEMSWDAASPAIRRARDGWCGFITRVMSHRPDRRSYATKVGGLLAQLDSSKGSGFVLHPDEVVQQSLPPIRGSGVYRPVPLTTFGSWDGPAEWTK